MIEALISIGTNSTRVLVIERADGTVRTLMHRSIGTRVGEGLKEFGEIAPAAMARTLDAVREHMAAIRAYVPVTQVIATSALRRAANAHRLIEEVHAITGERLAIISGDEEARHSFAGAVSGVPGNEGSFGVADCGGGSTEYAIGDRAGTQRVLSCEIGAVRITEAVPALAGREGAVSDAEMTRARGIVIEALAPLRAFPTPDRLLLVGGTATATVALQAAAGEAGAYSPLSRDRLAALTGRLRGADLESRRTMPGMNPQRADILLGGLLILEGLFEQTDRAHAIVSVNDLLLGFLLRHPASGCSGIAP